MELIKMKAAVIATMDQKYLTVIRQRRSQQIKRSARAAIFAGVAALAQGGSLTLGAMFPT